MKYYAVTEDPNELLHYGRLGMKWGQHIFGDKTPKSPAYKRAASKLRASVSKKAKSVKSAVKKSSTQRAIKRQQKQEAKFNKAVQKAQRRLAITENLHNLDVAKTYERNLNRAYKDEHKANRAAERTARKYARNERKMEKYMQMAREGRLRYGKLSEDQVQRVTDRLALERNARVLGSTEKPKFRTRMKDAVQEGLLKGTVEGMAAGMREVAIAKVQNRLKNKRVLDKKSKQQAKREHDASRIKNKKSTKEIKEDLKQELTETEIREGVNWLDRTSRFATTAQRAQNLKTLQQQKHEEQRKLNQQDRLFNERDEKWQRYLDEKGISEKQALKLFGGKGTDNEKKSQILRNEEEFNKQLSDAQKKAAYNKRVQEEKARLDAEAKDAEYARQHEEYKAKLEQYKEDAKYDRELKDNYDHDMKLYNAQIAMRNFTAKKPSTPKYRNTPKPNPPDYNSITVRSSQSFPSYEEYSILRDLGISTPFGNGNQNGKKKNKK